MENKLMIFENEGIPYQKFASRSDVSQGGTLGSIASKRWNWGIRA